MQLPEATVSGKDRVRRQKSLLKVFLTLYLNENEYLAPEE